MCGITGIIRWSTSAAQPAAARAEIERMTRCVRHRGPDDEGLLLRDGVALGQRRLSIIDLESGHQPMGNEGGSVQVVYNGEIYNFRELRDELESLGHRFATRCDTEIIVHAYEQWGNACVRHFRGMFAFAVVDFKARRFLLARDHFGIKPLVYRRGDGYLAFASELSALREVDDATPAGNLQAVELFLRYQYIPSPHTIYHDIFKLPPAHYLEGSLDGEIAAPQKYWQLRFEPENSLTDEDWHERAATTVRESVAAHLVADVPFGVFLSGGVDSTLIAWQMSQLLERPLQAFTIGFEEAEYSEIAHAKQAAARIGVELHSEIVRGDDLHILSDLIAHYGEPFGDPSALPTWHVAELARRQVPMVLSGDGGDEAFAGYHSYHTWMHFGAQHSPLTQFSRYLQVRRPRAALRALLGRMRRTLEPERLRATRPRHELAEWEAIMQYMLQPARRALWRPEHHALLAPPSELWRDAGRDAQHFDRLDFAQFVDFQTYLPGAILTKVDIASMYHGLEVRTPLVDLRVVELAASLPLEQRYRENKNNATGKWLLKSLLRDEFPPAFVHRRKQGFGIPRIEWFYEGGPGRALLLEVLQDATLPLASWFERSYINHLLETHHKTHDQSGALWLLLVLGLWLRQNPEVSFR